MHSTKRPQGTKEKVFHQRFCKYRHNWLAVTKWVAAKLDFLMVEIKFTAHCLQQKYNGTYEPKKYFFLHVGLR